MTAEVDGLNELIFDLTDAPRKAQRTAAKVVTKGAVNVANNARRFITGLAHAPHYPQSISFDVSWRGTAFEAVIGPDKERVQGALGNILEYGTSKNPPHAHLGPALDIEGPNVERFLAEDI